MMNGSKGLLEHPWRPSVVVVVLVLVSARIYCVIAQVYTCI